MNDQQRFLKIISASSSSTTTDDLVSVCTNKKVSRVLVNNNHHGGGNGGGGGSSTTSTTTTTNVTSATTTPMVVLTSEKGVTSSSTTSSSKGNMKTSYELVLPSTTVVLSNNVLSSTNNNRFLKKRWSTHAISLTTKVLQSESTTPTLRSKSLHCSTTTRSILDRSSSISSSIKLSSSSSYFDNDDSNTNNTHILQAAKAAASAVMILSNDQHTTSTNEKEQDLTTNSNKNDIIITTSSTNDLTTNDNIVVARTFLQHYNSSGGGTSTSAISSSSTSSDDVVTNDANSSSRRHNNNSSSSSSSRRHNDGNFAASGATTTSSLASSTLTSSNNSTQQNHRSNYTIGTRISIISNSSCSNPQEDANDSTLEEANNTTYNNDASSNNLSIEDVTEIGGNNHNYQYNNNADNDDFNSLRERRIENHDIIIPERISSTGRDGPIEGERGGLQQHLNTTNDPSTRLSYHNNSATASCSKVVNERSKRRHYDIIQKQQDDPSHRSINNDSSSTGGAFHDVPTQTITVTHRNPIPSFPKIIEDDYNTLINMLYETPSIFFDEEEDDDNNDHNKYYKYKKTAATLNKTTPIYRNLPNFDCCDSHSFEPYALGAALARESIEKLQQQQQQQQQEDKLLVLHEGCNNRSFSNEEPIDYNHDNYTTNNYLDQHSADGVVAVDHKNDILTTGSTSIVAYETKQHQRLRFAMYMYRHNIQKKDTIRFAENSRFYEYLNILKHEFLKIKNSKNRRHGRIRRTMRRILMSIMLSNSSTNDDNKARDYICLLGGVDLLCNYITHSDDDIKTLCLIVPIIGCLADNNYQRQLLISSHDGTIHVLKCLQRTLSTSSVTSSIHHNNNVRRIKLLQEECIIALYKLTTRCIQNVEQLTIHKGVDIVLHVMSNEQPNNVAIHKNSFGILLHIVKYDYTYVTNHSQIFLKLFQSMTYHKNSYSLQNVSIILLRQIVAFVTIHNQNNDNHSTSTAVDESNNDSELNDTDDDILILDEMIRYNVVSVLTTGMIRHLKHVKLIENGFACLYVICSKRYTARKQLVNESNLLNSIVRLIKKYESNLRIQRDGYKLLRTLKDIPSHYFKVPCALLNDTKITSIFARAGLNDKLQRQR